MKSANENMETVRVSPSFIIFGKPTDELLSKTNSLLEASKWAQDEKQV